MSHKGIIEQAIEDLRNASYGLDSVARNGSGRLARVAGSTCKKVVDVMHRLELAVEAADERHTGDE